MPTIQLAMIKQSSLQVVKFLKDLCLIPRIKKALYFLSLRHNLS